MQYDLVCLQQTTHSLFGLGFVVDRAFFEFFPDCSSSTTPRPSAAILKATSEHLASIGWETIYRSPELASGDPHTVIERTPSRDWIRVRYSDGTTFAIRRNGTEIRAAWTSPSTPADVAIYLLGPVIGLLLYLRGLTCLHASAIAHRGRALLFVGAAEAGKSTLAAAFARMKCRVLTDDVLLLKRRGSTISAWPGVPHIGLWPESVKYLWNSEDAFPRQVSTWEKRRVDLTNEDLFQDSPLPVGAIYLLAPREPNASPQIESLVGMDALLALIANKYVTRVSEQDPEIRDFVLLSELAASVPVRRVTRSDALIDLHATCEAILADHDAIASTHA